MKRQGFHHRKVRRLARELRRLGVSTDAEALGRGWLEGLWYMAATEAPRGDIGRMSDEDLADGVGCESIEPADLVRAFVRAEWLDEDPVHRLVVHDWPEHADRHVHRALVRAFETFVDGTPPRVSEGTPAEKAAWYDHFGPSEESLPGPPDPASGDPTGPPAVRMPGASDADAPGDTGGVPPGPPPGPPDRGSGDLAGPPKPRSGTESQSQSQSQSQSGSRESCRPQDAKADRRRRVVQARPPPLRDAGHDDDRVPEGGEEVAARVEEIRSRLRDRSSDGRNLEAIVLALPWPEIEGGLYAAWSRYRDGQVRNPTAYFVTCMRERADVLGIRLPGGRAGPRRLGPPAPAPRARAEGR